MQLLKLCAIRQAGHKMSKHWHHDRSQLNGVDKHEETAVQEEKASDTSVPRFLSDGINSEETAAKPSDGPTTIITVASSPMPQAPVVHKEKPQSNEPSMHGRVHVYEEGPGTAISLDLYARVFIKERDDNSLKLQCEMCTDPSFADPHTLIVLPKITLPKALFEEHENFLIFRLSQSSPMKKRIYLQDQ